MNTDCSREWTREFMVKYISKSFVEKQWKECQENLLYDKERALLPMTQEIAAARKRVAKYEKDVNEINEKINKLQALKTNVYAKIYDIQREIRNKRTPEKERQKFVKKCPGNECRGYLSSQWKCGTCEMWCCPDCHELKGETRDSEHTCNPDIVATISTLAMETKNCPNAACGVPIFKIDGCDQMWCTTCHTAFSWRSGRIETNIHNPHYYEYMRNNNHAIPRNPLDGACNDDELNHHTHTRIINWLRRILQSSATITEEDKEKRVKLFSIIEQITRNLLHLRYLIPRYQTNQVENNLELRIQYINNLITEETFKSLLQRRAKLTAKNHEYYQVLDMVYNTGSSIIFRFDNEIRTPNVQYTINDLLEHPILNEIPPLIKYANECLAKIAKIYSSKEKHITSLFYISL